MILNLLLLPRSPLWLDFFLVLFSTSVFCEF